MIFFFYFATIILSFCYHSAISQFIVNQTQQAYGSIQLNPAYSALHEVGMLNFDSRFQWLGFEGAPQTQSMNFHTPIGISNTFAGFAIISNKIGAEQNTGFTLNYATRIEVSHKVRVALGFSLGYSLYASNFGVANSGQPDEVFADYRVGNILVGIGGIIFTDKWYIGLSSPYLIAKRLGGTGIISKEPYQPDFYFQASHIFNSVENIIIKPSIIYRYLRRYPNIIDLGTTFYYKRKYNLGLVFRPGLSFAVSVGVQFFNSLSIVYSNDIIASQVQSLSRSSHEFGLRLYLNTVPQRKFAPKCYF